MIKVLLVDDQTLIRQGIRLLLEMEPDIQVVGQAADGRAAVEQVEILHPDVVLMDVRMPEMDGVAATRALSARHPEVKVIILTTFEDDEIVFEGLKAGARGYLLKDLEAPQLRAMLAAVERGEVAISPATAARILAEVARPSIRPAAGPDGAPEPDRLTEREVDVLRLVVAGLRNKEIAADLGISENTTKFHLRNILEKLHAGSRTEVAARAIREGLLPDR